VATTLQPLDEGERLGKMREACFFSLKFGRMDATPQAPSPDRVLQMQHLVIEQVFDRIARTGRPVEDTADDDGVVRGVVVAQRALGVVLAPGQLGAAQ